MRRFFAGPNERVTVPAEQFLRQADQAETLFTVQADRELTYESLRTAYGKLQVVEDAYVPKGMGFLFNEGRHTMYVASPDDVRSLLTCQCWWCRVKAWWGGLHWW